MSKRSLYFAVGAMLALAGCRGPFVLVHVKAVIPEPVFQLQDKMSVYGIRVAKLAATKDAKDERLQEFDYWNTYASNEKMTKYTGEIKYGEVPEGFVTTVMARQLDYGYYHVAIREIVYRVAISDFVILRRRDGGMEILTESIPYDYSFYKCLENYSFYEDEVKSKCFTVAVPLSRPN